ncbi:LysE family translocator [Corynebacterium diphtheriae]|uniref:LysE family translocator n=1 Tax=Corynebacterium diphtheriae TaxID=1717 RepID=UPI001FD1B485|nr:LysE family transporter [Corynebacterium diphtheriae]
MTLSVFGALAAVWAAAITLPGPDVLQIVRMGTKNRHLGMWCALGVMTGNTIWIVGSLLGFAAVLAARPEIVHLIQLVGGLYIAWMGVSSVWSGWQRICLIPKPWCFLLDIRAVCQPQYGGYVDYCDSSVSDR